VGGGGLMQYPAISIECNCAAFCRIDVKSVGASQTFKIFVCV
jgi:hypothetical protein